MDLSIGGMPVCEPIAPLIAADTHHLFDTLVPKIGILRGKSAWDRTGHRGIDRLMGLESSTRARLPSLTCRFALWDEASQVNLTQIDQRDESSAAVTTSPGSAVRSPRRR